MVFLIILIIVVLVIIAKVVGGNSKHKKNTYSQQELQFLANKRKADLDQRAKEFTENFATCFKAATDDKRAKYIFIDFETTDLPIDYKIPSNVESSIYPHVIQAGALAFNQAGELIEEFYKIIRIPENAEVAPGAERVHGISKETSRLRGVPIERFFDFVSKYLSVTAYVIAHNVEFDNYFLKLEAKRAGIKLPKYFHFCTMKSTKQMVGRYKEYGGGLKNPNLKELVSYAFFDGNDVTIANTHDARTDVRLCALSFFKLNLHADCE